MDSDGEFQVHGAASPVGAHLRAAREAQGLTLDQVAARTRVPMRHLAMIEEGAFQALPAATYSAGFVKAYARMLGLDGQALSDSFRGEIGRAVVRPSRPEPYEPADPRRTPPLGVALVALLAAVIAGLGFLYWRGVHDQPVELAARGVPPSAAPAAAPQNPAPAPVDVTSAGAVPVAPSAGVAQGGAVVIGASEPVWVKVVGSGKTLFMGLLKPGDHYQLPPDAADPELTTGRPGVTTISVGSTPIPPVGAPDRAAHGVSLKPEALLARVASPPPATQPPPGAATPVATAAGPA